MLECIKFLTAVFFLLIIIVGGYWVQQYENILPRCAKYSETDWFWVCRDRRLNCDKVYQYEIGDGCVYYNGKTLCGNFTIENATSLHCEDWRPWFNRKHTLQTQPLPTPPEEKT